MRAFLMIAAMFVIAGIGITLITSDGEILREMWIIVAVTVIALAAWSFIGRKKDKQ